MAEPETKTPGRKGMMRAFEAAAGQPWAIQEKYLTQILDIAQRIHTPDFEAVALAQSERTGNVMEMRDGVAVINVVGPIFRYANMFTMISGATSIDEIAADFGSALADPQVKAILFNFDSPGGELAGTSELAGSIAAARGKKPIWAYVDDLAASGAYWIASATDKIIASDTSRLGSIGVIATVQDEAEPQAGEPKTYRFISSVSPDKRPDLGSKEGQGRIQQVVDDLGQIFVSAVAQNRGVTNEHVMNEFGKGWLHVADKAVKAGMADEVGSFENTSARLSGRMMQKKERKPMSTPASAAAAAEKPVVEAEATEQTTETPVETATETTETKTVSPDLEYAAQVAELCVLAGQPKRTVEFIRAHKPVEDIRAALLEGRAAADREVEIHSRVLPETGAQAGPGKPEESLIVKAAQKLAATFTKK